MVYFSKNMLAQVTDLSKTEIFKSEFRTLSVNILPGDKLGEIAMS